MHHSVRKAKHFKLEYDDEYGYYVDDEFTSTGKSKGDRFHSSRWRIRENAWNTVYRPLKRFLEANVDRKWDDVYSEFCRRANNVSKTEKYKMFLVLKGSLNINDVQIVNGKPYYKAGSRWGISELSSDYLYVHPETGVLSRTPTKVEEKPCKKYYKFYDEKGVGQEDKVVNGVQFILKHKYTKHCIASGQFEDILDKVWVKEVKYTYMDTERYAVRVFGNHYQYNYKTRQGGYVDGWHMEYHEHIVEKVGSKYITASKKDIRKYKLNVKEQ